MKVIPIHNSDQENFLSCRRKWDLTSILRQAYRPDDMPKPLKFGLCMHKAYQVLYQPELWGVDRDTVLLLSFSEFINAMKAVRDKYLKDTGQEALDEEAHAEYVEMMDLGRGMLATYDTFARRMDGGWTPLGVEEDWEVPLGFAVEGRPVAFRFRTDLRMLDPFGDEWLWDHKTTSRMSESTDFLSLDPQMGKYLWGLSALGHSVAGGIYNEQYKGFPKPPTILKQQRLGRWLSTSRSQDTSYDLFLKAIEEQGEPVELYEEYLEWLKTSSEVKQWIRRTVVNRNAYELVEQQKILTAIAIEMLDNPRIYPSPSRWKCQFCMVQPVCLQMNEGSDWQWTLTNQYKKVEDHYGHAV